MCDGRRYVNVVTDVFRTLRPLGKKVARLLPNKKVIGDMFTYKYDILTL